MQMTYQMNVDEYLGCCGILKSEHRYNEKSLVNDYESVLKFYTKFIGRDISFLNKIELIRLLFRDNNAPISFIKQLSKEDKKTSTKNIDLSKVEYIDTLHDFINRLDKSKFTIDLTSITNFEFIFDFFIDINMPIIDQKLDKKSIEYVTGGWFEEYIYYTLQAITGLSNEYFKIGVALTPKAKDIEKAKYFTNNDLDVVFTKNNNLYVVECKSAGMDDSDLYNKTVYLASALKKYFGLTVKSVLCTLSEMKEDKVEKAETLGIIPIAQELLTNPNYKELFSKKIE
jgi:hypothetical protein